MKIICIRCGKKMGEKDGGEVLGVTHGVCDECLAKFREEMEAEKKNGNRKGKKPDE